MPWATPEGLGGTAAWGQVGGIPKPAKSQQSRTRGADGSVPVPPIAVAFGADRQQLRGSPLRGVGEAGMGEMDIRNKLSEWEGRLGADHPSIAGVTSSLAALLEGEERWREAEALHRRTLRLQESACGPEHANVAEALEAVARCLCRCDTLDDADALMKRATKIRRGGASQRKTAQCLELHAQVKGAEGEHALAAEHLQRALDLWPATTDPKGTDSLQVPSLLLQLAEALKLNRQVPQALDAASRAVAELKACHPPPAVQLAEALSRQGRLFGSLGRYEEAERGLREALRLNAEAFGEQDMRTAGATAQLALTLSVRNDAADEAEGLFQRAIDIQEGHTGVLPTTLAHVFKGYADLLTRTGRDEDAELLYRHCINLLRSSPGMVTSFELGSVVNRLGVLLVKMERPQEAEAQLEEAMRISETVYGKEHQRTAVAYENLANAIVLQLKREPEAILLFQKSVVIKEALLQRRALPSEDLAQALSLLGMLLKQCDRYVEGERYCSRASDVRRQQLDPDQLELEDFLRTGNLSSSGSMRPPDAATLGGAAVAAADASTCSSSGRCADSLPSPRVESVQQTRSPSGGGAKGGLKPLANSLEDTLQKSHDFREWAVTSGKLEGALQQVRSSFSGKDDKARRTSLANNGRGRAKDGNAKGNTADSASPQSASKPSGGRTHRRPPVPHPIHMLREAAKAQHVAQEKQQQPIVARARAAEIGPNLGRYTSLDLEDSILELEEERASGVTWKSSARSHVGTDGAEDGAEDDVLMGSMLGLTMGAEDEGWDSMTSDVLPTKMFLGSEWGGTAAVGGHSKHRATSNLASARSLATTGAANEVEEEEPIAVDDLLNSFLGSSRFSENNLEDSLDGLDGFLKQVRENPTFRGKRSLAAQAADLVPLARDGKQHSLNVDELISSLYP